MNAVLSMWTVCARPADYPEHFTARRSEILREGGVQPTEDLMLAPTLGELRAMLQAHDPNLTRLGRMPADEPVIVEVWL